MAFPVFIAASFLAAGFARRYGQYAAAVKRGGGAGRFDGN
tara:strand:- start:56184 stop:56303 length:120 start_codon:yes stop_codon:yes gene_type:complete